MKRIALALLTSALVVGAAPAGAQTLNQQGIARLNADVQSLWTIDGITLAKQQGMIALQTLVGQTHNVVNICDATITQVNSITINAPFAPGVTRLDGSGMRASLPLVGTWDIAASVRVHCHGKILGIDWYDDFNVGLDLKNFAASVAADFDSSDPTAPKVTRIYPPTVSFSLAISSTSDVVRFLGWITTSFVNPVANAVAVVAAQVLVQKLNVNTITPQVIGLGSTLAAVAPADLEGSAIKLEQDLQKNKMPHGDCVEGKFDRNYTGTWEQSLADPSYVSGNLNLVQVGTADDAACDSGWYLGALAFRYAATKAPDALADLKSLVAVYKMLLTMRGTPGDLNRSITPADPAILATLNPADGNWIGTVNGQQYIMSGYVSRDAYTGAIFGLSLAHDLISDPQVKADAGSCIEMVVDYLVANNWTHRKHDGSFDERFQGALDTQYEFVNAAYACDHTKYAPLMAQYAGYADLIWAIEWTSVIDPFFQYFKFGLGISCLNTALRTETDPVRYQRVYQGMAIIRHFIGHHQNASFNNFYLACDPSSVSTLGAENTNLLTRWLRQPRRYLTYDLRSDPTIAQTSYTSVMNVSILGFNTGAPVSVQVAKYPIPVEKRISSGFRWDRSPYSLTEDYLWQQEPWHEGESIDYIMPYWMARYYGAIPAPRHVTGGSTAVAQQAPSTN